MGKGRRPNRIEVFGVDVPRRIESFKEYYRRYEAPQFLEDAIQKSGFKAPTSVQKQIIPLMLDRRELICSAPTGSGKTLAFILPILHHMKEPKRLGSFRALILVPTRELAKQIHREALWISQGSNLRIHHLKDIKEAAKKFKPESLLKYDVLVTTPNKLSSLLSTTPPSISLQKLEWLVIDECDRVFDMGFKDDLTVIYKHCLESDGCRRAMFSATLEAKLLEWAQFQMTNVVTVIVGGKNRIAPNVEQDLIYVGNEHGKMISLKAMINSGIDVPVLIFVDTKDKAKYLATEFRLDDLNVDFIHSEREQRERDEIVTKFRMGEIWFLVCTDLMGRGIDFRGVNVVINYDCPKKAKAYIHRVGRTGRADRKGKAVTFITDKDRNVLPELVKIMRKSGCQVPETIMSLLSTNKNEKKLTEKNKQSQVGGSKPYRASGRVNKCDKRIGNDRQGRKKNIPKMANLATKLSSNKRGA